MQNKRLKNRNTGSVIIKENIQGATEKQEGTHCKVRTGKETEFVTMGSLH